MIKKKDVQNETDAFEETNEDISNLEETLLSKEREIEELNNKLLRLQADFINFRKRAEKEKENSIDYGIETFVCGLLPILDNFQRALESETNKESGFYKGVEMIEKQLTSLLNSNGIAEMDALEKPFDPNFHHAVLIEEAEGYDEGIVIGVLQKGYLLKDKVIRPSMVRVSQ